MEVGSHLPLDLQKLQDPYVKEVLSIMAGSLEKFSLPYICLFTHLLNIRQPLRPGDHVYLSYIRIVLHLPDSLAAAQKANTISSLSSMNRYHESDCKGAEEPTTQIYRKSAGIGKVLLY